MSVKPTDKGVGDIFFAAGYGIHGGDGLLGLDAVSDEALIRRHLADAGLYDPNIPETHGSEAIREAAIERRQALGALAR